MNLFILPALFFLILLASGCLCENYPHDPICNAWGDEEEPIVGLGDCKMDTEMLLEQIRFCTGEMEMCQNILNVDSLYLSCDFCDGAFYGITNLDECRTTNQKYREYLSSCVNILYDCRDLRREKPTNKYNLMEKFINRVWDMEDRLIECEQELEESGGIRVDEKNLLAMFDNEAYYSDDNGANWVNIFPEKQTCAEYEDLNAFCWRFGYHYGGVKPNTPFINDNTMRWCLTKPFEEIDFNRDVAVVMFYFEPKCLRYEGEDEIVWEQYTESENCFEDGNGTEYCTYTSITQWGN